MKPLRPRRKKKSLYTTVHFLSEGLSLLLLLLLPFTSGCTREDLSDCEYYLRFRYDYNMTGEDLFSAQVEEVKVFVFSPDGSYLSTLTEKGDALKSSGYRMKIPYEYYGCRMVVWAGRTDRFYRLNPLQSGSRENELLLEYVPGNNTSSEAIDNLWHSGPLEMTFPEEKGSMQTVSLLRETNDFTVHLEDKSGNPLPAGYQAEITSSNGSYNFDNSYPAGIPRLTYKPYALKADESGSWLLRTLRLVKGDDARLRITGPDGQLLDIGGESSVDLVEYLLMSTPTGMGSQEYLDRRYQWEIGLIVEGSAALAIRINGWVHWFHKIDQ